MGHGVSCARTGDEHDYFRAAQLGDLDALGALLAADPSLARRATLYDRLSALHIAAANGRLEVLSMILDHGVPPDAVNRHKQTPLMLAAMHGKIDCAQRLLDAGANILMFDSVHARTCLHHAAYFGHVDCLQAILSAAQTTPVADSWGFARFVNVRDDHGATPLHLAARQGRPGCLQVLLENGAIVSALTGSYGFPGSTSLHLAARSGNLDCIRKLLAWGADRLQRDSAGRIPYAIALKRSHRACAALLNPSSAEPMVWPSPLKFISELDPEAKALLEAALMEANREREKKILKGTKYSPLASPLHCDGNEMSTPLSTMHPQRRATRSCAASASTRRAPSRCRTAGTRCARRARWRCAATASRTLRRWCCRRRHARSAAAASRGCWWPGRPAARPATPTLKQRRRPPPRSSRGGGPGARATSATAAAAASRASPPPWTPCPPRSGVGRAGWPTAAATAAAWTSPSTTCCEAAKQDNNKAPGRRAMVQ